MKELLNYNTILLAFLAPMFTWLITASGSALIFFFKTINKTIHNLLLVFALGAMIFVIAEKQPDPQTG